MKTSRIFATIFRSTTLLVLLLLATVAFGIVPAAAAPADDTITIGVVLPTTGSESKPGQYQKEGI